MEYFRKREIERQLKLVSPEEWDGICSRCKTWLRSKLWGKTSGGAHAEKELGLPAEDYYLNEAIALIYEFRWEWKFEKFSLTEQIIRICNSLISRQVEKFKSKKEVALDYNDEIGLNVFDEVYEEDIDNLLRCIERIVAQDTRLCFYWEAIKEGYKPKMISELMNEPTNKTYKLNDKLIYQARTKCLN